MENDRKKGIGGTDISAILGMNPHKSALDVWLDKTGQGEPQEDNENMYWGRALEPALAIRYVEETGHQLKTPRTKLLVHPDKPFIVGSPDDLLLNLPAGVDYKTSGRPQDWGEAGTDNVPRHYHLQADWYMGLADAEWWDIAVLILGFKRQFMIFKVNRDNDLIGYLQDEAEKFWKDHVLTGIPPALDGSKSASEYLKRKYPVDLGPMLEPTDGDILSTIYEYRRKREDLKNLEKWVDGLENRLKAIVGDCAGMQGEWGKVTWRKSKDSQVVNWKDAFEEWASLDPTLSGIIKAKHTIIKPGARRWLPNFKEV